MKILVDHSVRQHAVTGEHGFTIEVGEVRGQTYRYLRPQTRHRPRRNDWLQDEVDQLLEIAARARDGRLQVYSTNELFAEAFRAAPYPSPQFIDVLEGCPISTVPSPFERSKFGLGLEQFASKDDVISYCNSMLTASPARIERLIMGMRDNPVHSLSPFEEQCLRHLSVFKRLCRGIHQGHYPDALHLWTAEENRLDAFLTLDRKFQNVVARQHANLSCRVLLPSELIRACDQRSG